MGQPTWQNALLSRADAVGAGGIARALLNADPSQPVWSGDYSDSQWAEWEYSRLQDPQTQAEYGTFLELAMPVLRRELSEYGKKRIYADGLMGHDPLPPTTPESAKNILGILKGEDTPGQKDDLYAREYVRRFLDYVRSKAEGTLSADPSVTPEQKAQWDEDPDFRNSMNSNYRLTPGGQKNLQAMRDYMILRTFQTDPVHRPEYLRNPAFNLALSAGGSFFDPTEMTGRQMAAVASGRPADSMRQTLAWTKYFDESNPEYWNDVVKGGRLPEFSASTLTGMVRKTGDGDSWFGRSARYLMGPMLRGGTEEQREAYSRVMNDFQRVTPIIPKSSSRNEAASFVERGEEMERGEQQNPSTYFPKMVRSINEQFGTNIAPFYPSGLANDILMVGPNVAGDPVNAIATAATGGLGLLRGGVAGMVGPLVGNLLDLPTEAGFSTGMSFLNTPQSVSDYISKPNRNVPLRDESGQIPDPADTKSYDRALERYEKGRGEQLQQAVDIMNNNDPNWLKTKPKATKLLPTRPVPWSPGKL